MALITLGAFCATFGGVSGYTVAIQFGGKRVATVFSCMNMCGNIGAALFPITAGWLVVQTGNWNLILLLFAGIMAVDSVCWALLNPTGTLFEEQAETSVTPPQQKPLAKRRRLLRHVLIYAVTPYIAIVVIVFFAQRWMIYQPTKTGRLHAKVDKSSQVQVDDVTVQANNGLTLHGWHFHASADQEDLQRLLVLYFPGNAGCRADRIADCRDFVVLGCDVVLFDYRGYGDNEGAPSEAALAADARQIWLFAVGRLHVPPQRIVIFGESLGGAVATRLAAEMSSEGTRPAALILNSTFASLAETVAWHYPAFPFQYLLLDRFPPLQRIPQVTCPVLQFHGTADDTVPFDQGKRLFDAAPDQSSNGIAKQFLEIPGGQHNFISVGNMQVAIRQLLAKLK